MKLSALLGLLLAAELGAAPPPVTPEEKAAADRIRPDSLRADVRFLASDLLEGRGPATRGDQLAQQYIASRMEALGLSPAAPDGSFVQSFEVLGIRSRVPEIVSFRKRTSEETVDLKSVIDLIAFSAQPKPEVAVEDAEIVFVGYGIEAPEYRWDDYKGLDVRGKVLLFMNNDPEDDPKLFAGKTRLYYGRWTYKYEMAAKKGAAAAIIIHTTPSAGYPWKVVQTTWGGEQFFLPDSGPVVPVSAWATEEASRRIVKLGGKELDSLREAARKRSFKPVPLGVTLRLAIQNGVRKTQTANVIGKVTGSDPLLAREAVVYTAHHDHLGMKKDAAPGEDAIYNGAVDNATGVAALLAIAGAMRSLPRPPERTVIFAAVGGEEQGLVGSRYLTEHPPLPAGRMVANLNIDSLNVLGRTRDVTQIGRGKSSLDGLLDTLAATQGRVVVPDAHPDKGAYYRSDHFNFARIGVPAVYLSSGSDFVGRPSTWGAEKQSEYESHDYHQPSDEWRPEWDLSGAVEDVQLLFLLGVKLAGPGSMPEWREGDEFEARRKQALAATPPGKR